MKNLEELVAFGPTIAVGAGVAGIIGANISTIFPYLGQIPTVLITSEDAAAYASSAAAQVVADAAGPLAIVLIFIQIGVTAAVNLRQTDSNQAAINTALAYNANQPPPLASMILDPVGYQKIFETFMAATLPDEGPSQAPPVPNNPSSFYSIFENELGNSGKPVTISPAFQYTSWDPTFPAYPASNGGTFQVNTYGNGWLVQGNNLDDGALRRLWCGARAIVPDASADGDSRFLSPAGHSRLP